MWTHLKSICTKCEHLLSCVDPAEPFQSGLRLTSRTVTPGSWLCFPVCLGASLSRLQLAFAPLASRKPHNRPPGECQQQRYLVVAVANHTYNHPHRHRQLGSTSEPPFFFFFSPLNCSGFTSQDAQDVAWARLDLHVFVCVCILKTNPCWILVRVSYRSLAQELLSGLRGPHQDQEV